MIYDYKCPKCEDIKELAHPMAETPEIVCDKCNVHMKKIISGGTATIFKGGGWSNDSKIKRDMTKKNLDAGKRMRENKRPVTKLSDLNSKDGL